MKRSSPLTIAFLIHMAIAFSQTNSKSHLSFMLGPAFAAGDFAKTNLSDETSGFAKTGEALSLAFTTPISRNWALLIDLSGQRNPINTGAFESSFSNAKIYQGFSFGSDPTIPPPQTNYTIYPNWTFKKRSWLYAALQVGAKGQFAVDAQRKTWLTAKATIGVLHATSPKLEGNSNTDTATALVTQSKASAFGVIYSLGIGLDHYLTPRIFLTSGLNYVGTNKVTFKNVKSTLTTTKGMPGSGDYSVAQSSVTVNGKQTLSSVNFLIGIGIVL